MRGHRRARDFSPLPDPPVDYIDAPMKDPPAPVFPVADGLAAVAAALNRIADALERDAQGDRQ